MGIYGALFTAVTGLRAQAFALENVSGNIANSQTTGYKRIETSFLDLVPQAPASRQVAGAVIAQSRSTNDVQGDINNADSGTFMAINGAGYFVVQELSSSSDGTQALSGVDRYTRRGDFSIDKDGYLVNGAGYALKGLTVDASTGNVSGSVPEVISITNDFLPANTTTTINYSLNLPQQPKNAAYDSEIPNSDLLNVASFTVNPTVAGTGVIQGQDSDTFIEQSISGGAITVFAPNGAQVNVQLRWAKTDSTANGGSDTWNLFYLSDSDAVGTNTAWTNVGVDYVFDNSGTLNPAFSEVALTGMTLNGTTIGNVTLDHGTNGVTQFADPNGSTKVVRLEQDGYAAGEFVDVAISENGRIVASYANGQSMELAQIVTAEFNASNKLTRLDGGIFQATSESGEAILSDSGLGIVSAALEASNTDISEEFTKLIVSQQAYAASTRVISISGEMLQEALNMVR